MHSSPALPRAGVARRMLCVPGSHKPDRLGSFTILGRIVTGLRISYSGLQRGVVCGRARLCRTTLYVFCGPIV